MTVSVYTLGCKLNQCESEAIADAFAAEGFSVVAGDALADLYIVNTCTVTSKAEQKARRMIRKYATEGQRPTVVVTGCYAQMERSAIEALAERVVVVSLDRKSSLLGLPAFLGTRLVAGIDVLEAVRSYAAQHESGGERDAFAYDAATFSYHSRAFLKIQDGCDNTCAYCRVTLARGAAVSLAADEVVQRALALEAQGYPEIVLTGVNITAYNAAGIGLGALLQRLCVAMGPTMRLRLSSLEPDRLDDELLAAVADSRIQPHFHIPVQSASDVVLDRCNRHYTAAMLAEAIAHVRRVKNDPFIAADIITGLPGETDLEFEQTFDFIKQHDIAQLHVFPYSPRPGTAMFHAIDRVPESVRDARAQRLRNLSAVQTQRYVQRQIGTTCEVMLEEHSGGQWFGLTGNYLRVRCLGVPPAAVSGMRATVTLEEGGPRSVPFVRWPSLPLVRS